MIALTSYWSLGIESQRVHNSIWSLIRATLTTLQIHFMSLFSIPRLVRVRIEHTQRNFLWGGGALENKPHLVKWEVVYRDKKRGGLGIKSLYLEQGSSL